MKVLVAVPALDMVSTDFAMSLAALMSTPQKDQLGRPIKVSLTCCKGSLIMHARNMLMQQAVDAFATHILFLDSDMVFPTDTLTRLAKHGQMIVGADYCNRVEPYGLNGKPLACDANGRAIAELGSGLINMLTLPFGCILIKLSALDGMARPWFKYLEGEGVHDTQSEDTYFCNAARQLGHTIFCDPLLTREIGHVGIKVFRPA